MPVLQNRLRRPDFWSEPWEWCRHNPFGVVALAGLALAVTFLVLWVLHARRPGPDSPEADYHDPAGRPR